MEWQDLVTIKLVTFIVFEILFTTECSSKFLNRIYIPSVSGNGSLPMTDGILDFCLKITLWLVVILSLIKREEQNAIFSGENIKNKKIFNSLMSVYEFFKILKKTFL